jgi:hypothetical protein
MLLGKTSALAQYVRGNRIDIIYMMLPMASQPRILKLLESLRETTASVYFTPGIFLFDLIQARMDSLGGMPLVSVSEDGGVIRESSRNNKRVTRFGAFLRRRSLDELPQSFSTCCRAA